MRFLMIVKANPDSEAGVMPEEEMLAAMGAYNEEMARAGVMIDGAGLQPTSKGFKIKFSGDQKTVVEGPFNDPNMVAGYWVIQVASRAEAIEWAKKCPNPHGPGKETEIEIRQFFELEDFGDSPAVEKMKELDKR